MPVAIATGSFYILPPMDELAQTMGVSRGKLREELVAAQAYGIVEMRPGDGTYTTQEDKERLQRIVERAERKLNGSPVEIPHGEHRDFHVIIFSPSNSPRWGRVRLPPLARGVEGGRDAIGKDAKHKLGAPENKHTPMGLGF